MGVRAWSGRRLAAYVVALWLGGILAQVLVAGHFGAASPLAQGGYWLGTLLPVALGLALFVRWLQGRPGTPPSSGRASN